MSFFLFLFLILFQYKKVKNILRKNNLYFLQRNARVSKSTSLKCEHIFLNRLLFREYFNTEINTIFLYNQIIKGFNKEWINNKA